LSGVARATGEVFVDEVQIAACGGVGDRQKCRAKFAEVFRRDKREIRKASLLNVT
jgi:hypothetical protein